MATQFKLSSLARNRSSIGHRESTWMSQAEGQARLGFACATLSWPVGLEALVLEEEDQTYTHTHTNTAFDCHQHSDFPSLAPKKARINESAKTNTRWTVDCDTWRPAWLASFTTLIEMWEAFIEFSAKSSRTPKERKVFTLELEWSQYFHLSPYSLTWMNAEIGKRSHLVELAWQLAYLALQMAC